MPTKISAVLFSTVQMDLARTAVIAATDTKIRSYPTTWNLFTNQDITALANITNS